MIILLPLIFLLPAVSSVPKPHWTIQQLPRVLKVVEGDTVELRCIFYASNGQLLAHVAFCKDPKIHETCSINQSHVSQKELPKDGLSENSTGFSLQIRNVSVCDSGFYICQVEFFKGPLLRGNGTTLQVERREERKAPDPDLFHTVLQITRICLLVVLICLASYLIVISSRDTLHPTRHRCTRDAAATHHPRQGPRYLQT